MKNPLTFRRLAVLAVILISLFITWSCEEPLAHASIITSEVEDVTIARATCGGFIADDGGSTITDRGIIWGLVPYINLLSNSGITHDSTGTGKFISKMTGLIPNTQYYIRAYAVSDWGVYYGLPKAFKTDNGIVDIEENEYHFVTIGTQTWMKENLKTTKLNDGTDIPYGRGLTTPCYTWYDGDIVNKDIYGALYNWYAANTGKLCPTGWHVPSETEWDILISYVGPSAKARSTTGWSNSNGTDDFGFTALPAGQCDASYYSYKGIATLWWSTSSAKGRGIFPDFGPSFFICNWINENGISIRCLKN